MIFYDDWFKPESLISKSQCLALVNLGPVFLSEIIHVFQRKCLSKKCTPLFASKGLVFVQIAGIPKGVE